MGQTDGAAVLLENGGTPTSPSAAPITYDKAPALSSAVANRTTQTGVGIAVTPPGWSVVHNPGAAAQATASKAAGGAGVRHVCTGIFAAIAAVGTAQTAIHVYLRDGATGVGTILWSGVATCAVNTTTWWEIPGLCIVGTANTAMTLEFEGAGVAASVQSVTLLGFDIT